MIGILKGCAFCTHGLPQQLKTTTTPPPNQPPNRPPHKKTCAAAMLYWEAYHNAGLSSARVVLTVHNMDSTGEVRRGKEGGKDIGYIINGARRGRLMLLFVVCINPSAYKTCNKNTPKHNTHTHTPLSKPTLNRCARTSLRSPASPATCLPPSTARSTSARSGTTPSGST